MGTDSRATLTRDIPPRTRPPVLLDAALAYAGRGWAVFPLHNLTPSGGCTCGHDDCESPCKHPRTEHGFHDATRDEKTIRLWWARWPKANIGVATEASGLVCVDVDVKDGKRGAENWLGIREELGHEIAETWTQRTPTGGLHALYRANGHRVRSSEVRNGIDTKAIGGYIVVTPSETAIGAYRWADGHSPDDIGVLDLPKPLGALLPTANGDPTRDTSPGATAFTRPQDIASAAHNLARLSEDRRDSYDPWVRVGMALAQLGDVGLALWRDWSEKSPKYKPGDCDRKWETFTPGNTMTEGITLGSLSEWAKQDSLGTTPKTDRPEPYHLTDMGNAERLIARHGADLHWCKPWGKWLTWDGRRWAVDDTEQVAQRAKETVRAIYAEASQGEDAKARSAIAKHAIGSEAERRVNAMIGLAASEPGVPVLPAELDADPWALNLQNGTLDLKTGAFRPHRRADMLTKVAPVDFDQDAECPLWLAFLDRVMRGNEALIDFLQRAVGYSLTGDTSEQVFLILHGTGSNGKTTFLESLRALLGDDYATRTPTETLLLAQRHNGGPTPELAQLRGARLVTSTEAEEGRRLAEARIKELTGGDTIAARPMYRDPVQFQPVFKLWLGTNHKPVIRGTDLAIWRRIRLIPFTVTIPAHEQDRRLADKLREELPGILQWALIGCAMWLRDGLGAPSEVTAATEEYRNEMDVIGAFLDDRCELGDSHKARAGALHKAYREWCEEQGERPVSGRAFADRLQERGFDKYRDRRGATYMGLSLVGDE